MLMEDLRPKFDRIDKLFVGVLSVLSIVLITLGSYIRKDTPNFSNDDYKYSNAYEKIVEGCNAILSIDKQSPCEKILNSMKNPIVIETKHDWLIQLLTAVIVFILLLWYGRTIDKNGILGE